MTNSWHTGPGCVSGAGSPGAPPTLALGVHPSTHLLLGGHAGKHLHVRDEAQQLLGVPGLQVRQAIPGEAQRVLLRQGAL